MNFDDDLTAGLLNIPGLVVDIVYLQRNGFRLGLFGYTKPGTVEDTAPRPMNALGLMHLWLRVDNPEELMQAVVRHGGRALEERTVTFEGANRRLMATDPEGNLLEMIERVSRPTGD